MAPHRPFDFSSSTQLRKAAADLGWEIPFQTDISGLFTPVSLAGKLMPNRMAIHPMEGADGDSKGSPGELTLRRYERYAQGGASLIWFEATAVVPEGRSNPQQLMITQENVAAFENLVKKTREKARASFDESHEIFCVLQLTHSGRYSKPAGKPKPQIFRDNPLLQPMAEESEVLSDMELDYLQDRYMDAAELAFQAGFDAVDIKSCHGYLLNEILAGYNRENSRYGQSFENRTRFLTETFHKIRVKVPGIHLTSRLSGFDGIPFPYGFGFTTNSPLRVDLTEIKALIQRLNVLGCYFINVSAGNPHAKPHLGRPFDRAQAYSAMPDEHPLEGIRRLLSITAELQQAFPDIAFIGTGYSWLRQYFPQVGAAVLAHQGATFIGMGRCAFAYPDAPKDLMTKGRLDPKKVCITCSRCSERLRQGYAAGCVVRDKEIYAKTI